MATHRRIVLACTLAIGLACIGAQAEVLGRWTHPNWPLKGKGSEMELHETGGRTTLKYKFFDGSSYDEVLEPAAPKGQEVLRYRVVGSEFQRTNAILKSGVLRASDVEGIIFRARPLGQVAALSGVSDGQKPAEKAKVQWDRTCRTDRLTGQETGCKRQAQIGRFEVTCNEDEGYGGMCSAKSSAGIVEEGPQGKMTLQMICSRPSTYDKQPISFGATGQGFPDYRSAWDKAMDGYDNQQAFGMARFLTPGGVEPTETRAEIRFTSLIHIWFKDYGSSPRSDLYRLLSRARSVRVEIGSSELIDVLHTTPIFQFDLTGSAAAFRLALDQPECAGAATTLVR